MVRGAVRSFAGCMARSAQEAKLNAAGIYVVQAVVGVRPGPDGREFKVRWEGYAETDE